MRGTLVLLVMLWASNAAAQRWQDATASCTGVTGEWSNEVDLADVDGDGLVDILVANGGDYDTPGTNVPSRVWKNQHFPGHMGNVKVTAKNLKVIKVDTDENLLLVRGSVPGPSGTYIFIRKARKAK